MKYLLLLLFFIFPNHEKSEKKDEVKCIAVYKLGFGMQVPVDINCDNFLERRPDSFFISDKHWCNRVVNEINASTPVPEYNGIDTRAKLFIKYKSGHIDTVCIGETVICSYNNKMMELRSRYLKKILDSLGKK
jgi:hypothetical protein